MAGIKNPPKEIDVAEVYDPFDYKELHYMEGLRLCKNGTCTGMGRPNAVWLRNNHEKLGGMIR